MKYLVNICAHDGIASHYTGVGSMVERYIIAIEKFIAESEDDFTLNLITPEYQPESFGFLESQYSHHIAVTKKLRGGVYMVSNGSDGEINYGDSIQWRILCENTANLLTRLSKGPFDQIITIYNDTPFAQLGRLLDETINTTNIWIPHSTVKIHGVNSALEDGSSQKYYQERLVWEQQSIDAINSTSNGYVGVIGSFITTHLVDEYGLLSEKCLDIYNGIIVDQRYRESIDTDVLKHYLSVVSGPKPILLSYARAEDYKNLEYTMRLGAKLHDSFQTIVIAQSYFPTQPILARYRQLAHQTSIELLIDPPFSLPKYILGLDKDMVVLVPSTKEVMGLIINEVRAYNKDNLMIVANNIPGLQEQIVDGVDGILVDADGDIEIAARKIKEAFTPVNRKYLKDNAAITIAKKYNIVYNVDKFLKNVLQLQKKRHPYANQSISRN